ncbi:class I adenylate-forming enzyme family protein [Dietzia natronolimnaea]|uniref:class I adenylate-forming enzyme family protein n=1 Tax=Dietzia natronolimnaea TaxID=161920 RepID=UPI001F50C029|nr:AMP-binding protein [Dietzia natronolimnaea]
MPMHTDLLGYFVWNRTEGLDSPFARDESTALTYREFSQLVAAYARILTSHGVGERDVVAVHLSNRVEFLVAVMAAWSLRAVATPVNPVLAPAELEHQLGDSNTLVVVTESPDAIRALTVSPTVLDVAECPTTGETMPTATCTPEDTALLVYTSGSTGRPKGVELTHANLEHMTRALAEHVDARPDEHCLLVLPLFHVNAICVSFLLPAAVGGRLTLLRRFRPVAFLDAIEEHRPTYFSAVPAIFATLADTPGAENRDFSCLRRAICGAAPVSRELLDRVTGVLGIPVVEGYGLTEGTCASTCNPPGGPIKAGTVGIPLPGISVKVVDHDGGELPVGHAGEVMISGPTVMKGYLGMPDATAETIEDGWLHTGDVGRFDADGYLTLVDRIKDMIIRGGENLYPKEIENALATHPAVLECAVVGAPHQTYGEIPVAYVVTYADTDVTEDDLLEAARDRITKIKLPAAIHFVDELPRNPVGKIDKPSLRRVAALT